VALASRGLRKLGDEEEKIADGSELVQVRRQARRVMIKALFAALVLTLIAYLLPF
jgi:hypothetical protein